MPLTPPDRATTAALLAATADSTVAFFDLQEKLVERLHVLDHPEAIDLEYLCAFRRVLLTHQEQWHICRELLTRLSAVMMAEHEQAVLECYGIVPEVEHEAVRVDWPIEPDPPKPSQAQADAIIQIVATVAAFALVIGVIIGMAVS